MPAHASRLATSPRLRRVRDFLADGEWRSTREIVVGAEVCAVNSVISELRANGCSILCRRDGRRWFYRLLADAG